MALLLGEGVLDFGRCRGYVALRGIPVSLPATWFLCLSKRHILSADVWFGVLSVSHQKCVGTGLCLRDMPQSIDREKP